MSLKRGSVLGALLFSFVLVTTVEGQAQAQGVPGRVAALQAQLEQALATIKELQVAVADEAKARQAADAGLQTSINALVGGGVSQAVLDAAIASESSARSAADAAFEASLMPLASLATYMKVDTGTINDLAGPHIVFTGANVHIRSGHFSGNSYRQNGLGNLVLGYNEPSDSTFPAERGGSHNLVVGPNHRYNFGVGLVVGGSSRLGNDGASVSGGFLNSANGLFSSVSSGLRNDATGDFSSVGGGADNIASGNTGVVTAGQMNQATGDLSSVTGGSNNVAGALFATVTGGTGNTNTVMFTVAP